MNRQLYCNFIVFWIVSTQSTACKMRICFPLLAVVSLKCHLLSNHTFWSSLLPASHFANQLSISKYFKEAKRLSIKITKQGLRIASLALLHLWRKAGDPSFVPQKWLNSSNIYVKGRAQFNIFICNTEDYNNITIKVPFKFRSESIGSSFSLTKSQDMQT